MRRTVLIALLSLTLPAFVRAQTPNDQVPLNYVANANAHTSRAPVAADGGGVLGHRSNGSVLGVDSLPNWSSYFYEPALDTNGFPQFTWPYTMVGRSPFNHNDDQQGDHDDSGT